MEQKKELITVSEFAKRRNVPRETIYNLINIGSLLPSEVFGAAKTPLIDWLIYEKAPLTLQERNETAIIKGKSEYVSLTEFAKRRQFNRISRDHVRNFIKLGLIEVKQESGLDMIDWNKYHDFPITKEERENSLHNCLKASYGK